MYTYMNEGIHSTPRVGYRMLSSFIVTTATYSLVGERVSALTIAAYSGRQSFARSSVNGVFNSTFARRDRAGSYSTNVVIDRNGLLISLAYTPHSSPPHWVPLTTQTSPFPPPPTHIATRPSTTLSVSICVIVSQRSLPSCDHCRRITHCLLV